ncbi:MAG: efflux transporter outer membrane subunit [Steroidobacter sp.]
MRCSSSFAALSLVVLGGCVVGPTFETPNTALPAEWSGAATTPASDVKSEFVAESIDRQWWLRFNDPVLTSLIGRAREANLDLRMAALRFAQSRVQRSVVAGGRVPSVTASGSYQRQRQSEFGTGTRLIDAIGAPTNRDAIIDVLSEPYDVYQAGFDASWEIDLWGRVRRAVEAADASVAANQEELHAVQLSIAAEVARTYFEFRGVQDLLRLAADDLAASEDALGLTSLRAEGGLVTQLDVVSHRARLADARARIPQLQQRETQLGRALELLLGESPGALDELLAAERAIPAPPAQVAIGIPTEIARQRPDIRGAEAQLHAATAEIGVAAADLYPRITLTGGFLSQSLEAADLSEWGARQWAVGPSVHLPIFDGGRRRAIVELRELQQQEAAVNYQRTVLRAWHEIDAALSGYIAEQRRNQELAAAAAESRDAYEIANVRYQHGLTNFLVAIDAQRTLLHAERAYSESTTAVSTQLTALYKSLGGGWEER